MLNFDGQIEVARGRSRHEKHWQNVRMQWSELVDRLAMPTRTSETLAEYNAASKADKTNIKDVGGIVGGILKNGKRNAKDVVKRTIIALDADYATDVFWQDTSMMCNFAICMHSTHTHTPLSPRLRLYIPLSRPVSPDEAVAIGRMLAFDFGIEHFDDSTYEPHRLMFWPSVSSDGEFLHDVIDAKWLNPDVMLKRYNDWADVSQYPRSSREAIKTKSILKNQEDPTQKAGLIGAFCKAYPIRDAIAEFLQDVYEPCAVDGRYTYKKGSTASGVVVYDDVFAYSNHGTDPAGGQLCNAFDLVRIHHFSHLDDGIKANTPVNKHPSFSRMIDFIKELPAIKPFIKEAMEEAFKENLEDGEHWSTLLKLDGRGNYLPTIWNLAVILRYDEALKGTIAQDAFEHREVLLKDLPWRSIDAGRPFTDTDESQLKLWFESRYNIINHGKVRDALGVLFSDNTIHPIKDYLNAQVWDGVERVDSLFIDYLGAEDSIYTRTVTRKMLIAAVARIFDPGCKFDNMLVLVGKQGVGKSTILRKLGCGKWFSDSFTTMNGKEAFEQLQGSWIIEVAELSGMQKSEVETVKHFISKQEDRFRVAYGKRVGFFQRQCVFFGTTNNRSCLRDETGNRRFWPVDVLVQPITRSPFDGGDLTPDEVGQIWAEAVRLYKNGESLDLSKEVRAIAEEQQEAHTEEDPKFGIVQEYLNILLPPDWEDMDLHKRRNFISGTDRELVAHGTAPRTKVCIPEIWDELFCNDQSRLDTRVRRELHAIMRNMPGWKLYPNNKGRSKSRRYGTQTTYYRDFSTYGDSGDSCF